MRIWRNEGRFFGFGCLGDGDKIIILKKESLLLNLSKLLYILVNLSKFFYISVKLSGLTSTSPGAP